MDQRSLLELPFFVESFPFLAYFFFNPDDGDKTQERLSINKIKRNLTQINIRIQPTMFMITMALKKELEGDDDDGGGKIR